MARPRVWLRSRARRRPDQRHHLRSSSTSAGPGQSGSRSARSARRRLWPPVPPRRSLLGRAPPLLTRRVEARPCGAGTPADAGAGRARGEPGRRRGLRRCRRRGWTLRENVSLWTFVVRLLTLAKEIGLFSRDVLDVGDVDQDRVPFRGARGTDDVVLPLRFELRHGAWPPGVPVGGRPAQRAAAVSGVDAAGWAEYAGHLPPRGGAFLLSQTDPPRRPAPRGRGEDPRGAGSRPCRA